MKNSSSFVAALLSLSAMACAGSNVHTPSARLDRLPPAQQLGDLWVSPPKGRPGDDMQVVYRSEARSDLWNRKGFEFTEDPTGKPTPRIDAVLSRLTPVSSETFVETSHPKRASY
jgi:hypothetical protein